jgi:hypothetical protein
MDLRKQLAASLRELNEAYIAASGVKVGQIVTYLGDPYRVVEIEPRRTSSLFKPWLVGTPKKKDGSWSNRSINLYGDWQPVAQATATPQSAQPSPPAPPPQDTGRMSAPTPSSTPTDKG